MQNNDLISREALLDIVGKMPLDWEYGKAVSDIYDIIKATPAVDAVPVVHGRWVHVPSSDMMTGKAYKCSKCSKMRYGSFMPNYCGNCGARMDGATDG